MTKENQIATVPRLPTERSLAELYRELAIGVEGDNVAALILEDFRRVKQPIDLPQTPTELEVRIAVAYDIYRALTQGNGNLSMVPEWLEVSGRKILESPFKADYLRSVDSLLRQRTSEGVDRARQILDIIGWTEGYRGKVIFALKDLLLTSTYVHSAEYAVATLRKMGAETELLPIERELLKRVVSSPYDSKVSAAIILKALLGKITDERGKPQDELRALIEEAYARFPIHPNQVLYHMQMIGLIPDRERLFAIVKSYRDSGQLYQAGRMALALKKHNMVDDSLIKSIDGLVAVKKRRERIGYIAAHAAILGIFAATYAGIVKIDKNMQTTRQVRLNHEEPISVEYERARNWMTVYRRSIVEGELPGDVLRFIHSSEKNVISNEWHSKGKEYALAIIRAKIEGSIRNLTNYRTDISKAPLPEVQKAALRNIAWTYVRELQKGLEGLDTKK